MKTCIIRGLKITGVISPRQLSACVFADAADYYRQAVPVVEGEATQWANGSAATKWIDVSVAGKAVAFVRWLSPSIDEQMNGAVCRARYTVVNWETGAFEAAVYGEHAADVLRKAGRICRSLSFNETEV